MHVARARRQAVALGRRGTMRQRVVAQTAAWRVARTTRPTGRRCPRTLWRRRWAAPTRARWPTCVPAKRCSTSGLAAEWMCEVPVNTYFSETFVKQELPSKVPPRLRRVRAMSHTLQAPTKPASVLSRGTDSPEQRSIMRRAWITLSAGFAAFLGLLPHVLHHAGPFAGAALLGGLGGSLLFGAIGFLAAIPVLTRMHRRFGTWRAPATALALFVAVFSVSTFVVGPAISGDGNGSPSSVTSPDNNQIQPSSHEAHHQ
jgi:hypothetical protein